MKSIFVPRYRRIVFLAVLSALIFGFPLRSPAQNVSNFKELLDALNQSSGTIDLKGNLTGKLSDDDGGPDFQMDDPITGTVTINTGGHTIRYASKDGDDYYGFAIDVDGGTLIFEGNANLSGGYGSSGLLNFQDGSLVFHGDANLSDNYTSAINMLGFNELSTLTVSGTLTLNNNISDSGGAGLYLENATATIGALQAKGNSAEGDGGVINFTGNESVLVVNGAATFGGANASDGNTAVDGRGGAVYIDMNATATFNGPATFQKNKATGNGGGALYVGESTVRFGGGATFQDNVAEFEGGAVYLYEGQLSFTGDSEVKFIGNVSSDVGGGALYAYGTESKILFENQVTFQSNTALFTNDSYGGGAAYISQLGNNNPDDLIFGWTSSKKAVFTSNTGWRGGALFVEMSAMEFADAEFTGNTASVVQNDVDFGEGGGALYVTDSILVFRGDTLFSGNQASGGSGGAIFAEMVGVVEYDMGSDSDIPPVYGLRFEGPVNQFTNNKAKYGGGAFHLDNAAIAFGGTTTISDNSTTDATDGKGGAFYIASDSVVGFLSNSQTTITGNNSARGGAFMVEDGANLVLRTEAGTSNSSQTTLTVAKGTTGKKNDVYLGEGSLLTLNTDKFSSMTFASDMTSADETSEIVKNGEGAVYIDGNASGFTGSLTINGGDFYIGKTGTFGNIDSTILNIEEGGYLVLDVGEATGANTPRIYLETMNLNGTGETVQVAAKALNDSLNDTKYAFVRLVDDDGSILQGYIDDGLIGSYYNFLTFNSEVRVDDVNGVSTLYVGLTFDPNKPWDFHMPRESDEFTLNAQLNDAGKAMSVTGDGQLKVNNNNTVAGLTGDGNLEILDGKTYTVAGSDGEYLFEGNIAGPGAFVKDGNSTQKLTGNNTYSGGTTLRGGTLSGNSNSLQGNISTASGTTLEFDQRGISNGAYAGSLSGEGSLVIMGDVKENGTAKDDSVLKFGGNSSGFTGNTDVRSGWLVLESTGDLRGSAISVQGQGGLGGAGRIKSAVIHSGGAIQAYGGNMKIDNTLEFQQGGIIYVAVNGANTSVIDVAGKVTLNGATVKVVDVGSDYKAGERNTFIKGDSFEGSFASGKIVYGNINFDLGQAGDGKSYYLVGDGGDDPDPPVPPPPTPAGLTYNQTGVAFTLDSIGPGTTGLPGFITELNTHKTLDENGNTEYDAIYRDATQQLAGSVRHNGMLLGMYSPGRSVLNRIQMGHELYSSGPIIYNNGYGVISGLETRGAGAGNMMIRGQYALGNSYGDSAYEEMVYGDEGEVYADCYNPCFMGERQFWADAVHVQTKTRGDGNSDGYGISRTGLLIGMDFQRNPTTRIGALFGYFAPYLWQNSDRVEADDYHFGLYFHKKYYETDFYGYFGYAHQEYDSRRFVDMSAVNAAYARELYTGSTKGDSFSMNLEVSRPRYYGCDYILRPLIALDYIYTSQKGYQEVGSGSGLFGLGYDKADYDQLFVRIGLNLKKESAFYSTIFRLQYINQFGTRPYPDANSRFLVAPGSPIMNIRGVDMKRDYLNLGFGINLFLNGSQSKILSFDYDANMSKRTTAHGLWLNYVERF